MIALKRARLPRVRKIFLPLAITLAGAIALLLANPARSEDYVPYSRSGGATPAEIARLKHLNWDQGQSISAIESDSGLGAPTGYIEPADNPDRVVAVYNTSVDGNPGEVRVAYDRDPEWGWRSHGYVGSVGVE